MSAYYESIRRRSNGAEPQAAPLPLALPSPRVAVDSWPAEVPGGGPFDALREQLVARANGRPIQAIAFAGCGRGERCGGFVRAFGDHLASQGSRVLVVDGDGRPDSEAGGLASAVRSSLGVATEPHGSGRVARLTMGVTQGEKDGFLRSPEFLGWLEAQRAAFDYLLFAAPPVGQVADAMLLGRATDGVLLLVHAESTERSALSRAREYLDRGGVHVLGAVLDQVRHELPETLRRYLGEP